MEFSGLSFALGMCVGAGVVFAALWPRIAGQKRMEDQFELAAARAIKTAQDQLVMMATEKLSGAHKDAGHDLDKRHAAIAALVDPVAQKLKDVETKLETLGKSEAALDAHLRNFADDQRRLQMETARLSNVMRSSQTRGQWGELQLQRTLELVGLVEGQHFRRQVNVTGEDSVQRPDFVVDMPGRLSVVIDAKVPLDPYFAVEQNDAPNDADMQAFKTALRGHMRKLSSKEYWRGFNSPEFVVMFLPTESLFSLAIANDRSLVEDAAAERIIIASPTTILGLLRLVGFAWQQQALAENAKTIGTLAEELRTRLGTFFDHLGSARKNLVSAMAGYDNAIKSLNARVLPQLRKIEKQRGKDGEDLPDLAAIEYDDTRALSTDDKAA